MDFFLFLVRDDERLSITRTGKDSGVAAWSQGRTWVYPGAVALAIGFSLTPTKPSDDLMNDACLMLLDSGWYVVVAHG